MGMEIVRNSEKYKSINYKSVCFEERAGLHKLIHFRSKYNIHNICTYMRVLTSRAK